ncbi:MAG: phage head-tail connector protein [Sphingobium sp.]
MPTQDDGGALAVSLAELKAYLRIGGSDEDALLAGLLRGAAALCEQFIGQWLIVRAARETVTARRGWTRLAVRPVIAIDGMAVIDTQGAAMALAADSYAIDIDGDGEGWIRVMAPDVQGKPVQVRYRAGMAEEMNGLPEPIRQGIVRLAADHHASRAGDGASPPPAVVSALWRPWRRMRLA